MKRIILVFMLLSFLISVDSRHINLNSFTVPVAHAKESNFNLGSEDFENSFDQSQFNNSLPSEGERLENLAGKFVSYGALSASGKQSYIYTFLSDDGEEYRIYPPSKNSEIPKSGSRIVIFRANTLAGSGGNKVLLPFKNEVTQSWMQVISDANISSVGEKRVLVYLVNFEDIPTSQPWSVEYMRNRVFEDVNQFNREVSFGKTYLTGDVVGWITVPLKSTEVCSGGLVSSRFNAEADKAATAKGFSPQEYPYRLYVFPRTNCGWAGLGSVGSPGRIPGGGRAWINGATQRSVIAHELGHNIGLLHSNALNCPSSNPLPIGEGCRSVNYQDLADTMGLGQGHFNAFQKERIGWLNANGNPPIKTVTKSGIYTLDVYETNSQKPKALKILKKINPNRTGSHYYIEYRQGIGFDKNIPSTYKGVVFHVGDESTGRVDVLRMGRLSGTGSGSVRLEVGKSFEDSTAANGGLKFTVLSANGREAKIQIEYGNTPPPECVRANPVVTITPSDKIVQAGEKAVYTVSVENKDGENCLNSYYTLKALEFPNLNVRVRSENLAANPGTWVVTFIDVVSSSTLAPGSYPFTIELRNKEIESQRVIQKATYTVKSDTVSLEASVP
jgi:hypothetical protein